MVVGETLEAPTGDGQLSPDVDDVEVGFVSRARAAHACALSP